MITVHQSRPRKLNPLDYAIRKEIVAGKGIGNRVQVKGD